MNNQRKRIVIIGGGFGGAYCAQSLEKHIRHLDAEYVLIDRHNYFIFYPLLVEAGIGSLEPRHTVVPIRNFMKTGVFRMGDVHDIDFDKQLVHYRIAGSNDEASLHYDQLVLSPGSVTRLPDVPGLHQHGYEMKELIDAVCLRDRAIQLLEHADSIDDPEKRKALLHFVVVGANFSGAEVAGEYHAFLRAAAKRYRNIQPKDCRVTLVEMLDHILDAFKDPDLSQWAEENLRRRGIDIRLETMVNEVKPDGVILSNDEFVPAHTTIWCAGIAVNPLITRLNLPTDDKGYLTCEPDMRVKGFQNIWALGDCAVNPDPEGNPYPPTAQSAVRQGSHLARNLGKVLRGEQPEPCRLRQLGSLAALGHFQGAAKVFGIKLSGFPAWFLWRTVYLWKMPGFGRKIRVAVDWTLDLIFRRDFVQLGLHTLPPADRWSRDQILQCLDELDASESSEQKGDNKAEKISAQ